MDEKYCTKCGLKKEILEFSCSKYSWCKPCLNNFSRAKWQDRKKKIIEIMGGKCCICGYNKNYASLDLHHINPKIKKYNSNKLKIISWDKVLDELKKCILVCRNCHGEIHHPQWDISTLDNEQATVDNLLLNFSAYSTLCHTGNCPICDKDVYGTKYCSQICAKKARRKVIRPSKDELAEMLLESNYCAVSRKYGVSDNTVRKWARSYEIL